MTLHQLSPSDLTFLWDECPRCFYLKVTQKFNRPFGVMPKIFNKIDKLMKDFYAGQPTQTIPAVLPEGAVKFGEKWVHSQPLTLPGHADQCFFRGKFDTVVEFT